MQTRRPLLALLAACACVVPAPAVAQSAAPPLELYAGYSYLRDPGNSILSATSGDDSFPIGWAAGAAHRVWRAVAIVGDVSGHHKRRTTLDEEVSLSFLAFLGGARASARLGPLTEFVQALGGAVHSSGSGFGVTAAATDLALQAGGGADYPLARRFAARLQLDYRWIHGADGRANASQFRALAALVFR